jgi:hypothetical protein
MCLSIVLPIPSLFKTQPGRYEFHLTSFTENLAKLEAVCALRTQYGHPDVHIVVTVSPVPVEDTISTMDSIVTNTRAKSLLRAVVHERAAGHANVDYFPSYAAMKYSCLQLCEHQARSHKIALHRPRQAVPKSDRTCG